MNVKSKLLNNDSDSYKYKLGIETTSNICGISLIKDSIILEDMTIDASNEKGLSHSVILFTILKKLFEKYKINSNNISDIYVSNGPGSYTGIRIGVACALGLSFNTKINVYYVDTLTSLAYNAINKADFIFSMIDARVGRVYLSIFQNIGFKKILNDTIIDINSLIDNLNNKIKNTNVSFVFVGNGYTNYKEIFNNKLKINYTYLKNKDNDLKASSLIFCKGKKFTKAKLNYVIESKAEREYKNKNV